MKERVYLCSAADREALALCLFHLRTAGIDVREYEQENDTSFALFVPPGQMDAALGQMSDLMEPEGVFTDEGMKGVVAPDTDYIDGVGEWAGKMYVDGYFTGGRLPYFLLNPQARWLVVIVVIGLLFNLFLVLYANPVFYLLVLPAGIVAIWKLVPPKEDGGDEDE